MSNARSARDLVLVAFNVPSDKLVYLSAEFPAYEFQTSNSEEEQIKLAKEARILLTDYANEELISSAKKCVWIQTLSAGVEEYLKLSSIRENDGLTLTNASGVHGIPISEHLFALLLFLTRGMRMVSRGQEKREWVKPHGDESGPFQEIFSKTMVLVGLGSIGLEIAKRAKSFGMKTIALKLFPAKELKVPDYSEFVDEIANINELASKVGLADVIVNSLPLTKDTAGIFDRAIFLAAKRKPIFLNVGRGKTVVEQDLVEALENGYLSGAGLDVFEDEPLPKESRLWGMENVVVSPHVSGNTPVYYERAIEIFKDNLHRFEKGETLRNIVDKRNGY